MSQIHNDSDRLRAFAIQLQEFGAAVDDQLNALRGAMSRLGRTWKDDDYSEFKAEFVMTQQRVRQFIEETRAVTPKLTRDADKLDEYGRVHVPK